MLNTKKDQISLQQWATLLYFSRSCVTNFSGSLLDFCGIWSLNVVRRLAQGRIMCFNVTEKWKEVRKEARGHMMQFKTFCKQILHFSLKALLWGWNIYSFHTFTQHLYLCKASLSFFIWEQFSNDACANLSKGQWTQITLSPMYQHLLVKRC